MSSLVVGIDGGGTATRAWLARADGTVLGTAEAGASNVFANGVEAAGHVLAEVISNALAAAGAEAFDRTKIGFVYAGVAGAGTAEAQKTLSLALARAAGINESRCHVDHDLSVALAGAIEGNPGIIVLAGTGSASFGRNAAGQTWRAGGWGPVLDDVGSGYWLGMEAMKTIVRAADGRVDHSPMNAAVLAALSVSGPRDLIAALRDGAVSRPQTAALAPLVLNAVQSGDPVAVEIAGRGADELASLAVVVAKVLELGSASSPGEVACVGGLLDRQDEYFRMVSEALARKLPAMKVRPASLPPVGGAVALAIERLGSPLNQAGWKRLRISSSASTPAT